MRFKNWYNAIRTFSIPQEIMDSRKTICTCEENPKVNECDDNSWLPCKSNQPGCNLKCKDCIFCKVIFDDATIKMLNNQKTNSINFGVFDLSFNKVLKDEVIKILKDNPESVLNYEIADAEKENDLVYICIDAYDNKTIGNVLNQLAKIEL